MTSSTERGREENTAQSMPPEEHGTACQLAPLPPQGLSVPHGEPQWEVEDVPPSKKPDPRREPLLQKEDRERVHAEKRVYTGNAEGH